MSTRSVINFCHKDYVAAKVYRHSDGYPEGILPDLEQFFADVEAGTSDTRFNDPSYLAAKYVVWQAGRYSRGDSHLNFLGVGIVVDNPGDIEYEYFVDCGKGGPRPTVTYAKPQTA